MPLTPARVSRNLHSSAARYTAFHHPNTFTLRPGCARVKFSGRRGTILQLGRSEHFPRLSWISLGIKPVAFCFQPQHYSGALLPLASCLASLTFSLTAVLFDARAALCVFDGFILDIDFCDLTSQPSRAAFPSLHFVHAV